jgi:hypothetical protein
VPLYKPTRYPWNALADVIIVAGQSDVKRYVTYEEAKTGDVAAAKKLAAAFVGPAAMEVLAGLIPAGEASLVPVHALENQGYNRIPAAFAELLGEKLGLPVEEGIIQANVVNHTGASGWERMVRQALFEGQVVPGRSYVMVDDFIGLGGTLANLRGYLMADGGSVKAAITLTGRTDSAKLALQPDTLAALRAKYGQEFEAWWQQEFGYDFACVTESEARYLLRVEDADTVRTRLSEARPQGDG